MKRGGDSIERCSISPGPKNRVSTIRNLKDEKHTLYQSMSLRLGKHVLQENIFLCCRSLSFSLCLLLVVFDMIY